MSSVDVLGEPFGKLGLTPDAMEHVTALNQPMSLAYRITTVCPRRAPG